jgi:hypothetical protein
VEKFVGFDKYITSSEILIFDEERTVKKEGKTIEIKPAWRKAVGILIG